MFIIFVLFSSIRRIPPLLELCLILLASTEFSMLAAAFLSSAGFSPSLRTAAPLTAAQPRYASLVMSQPPRPQLELPAKLLELGCDAELWSEVQPRHDHTARPHRVVQPGPVCGTPYRRLG